MTAWEWLKANSSLAVGTAWELLTNPKASGTGVVLNDGYTVTLEPAMTATLDDRPVITTVAPATEAELALGAVVAELVDKPLDAAADGQLIYVEGT